MSAASSAAGPNGQTTLQAEVLESTVVDEALLVRLLRRAGRTLARPALECFEILIDGATPHQARITVLAALTYLVLPFDLIPDFIPVIGFLDELILLPLAIAFAIRLIPASVMADARARASAQPQRVKLIAGALLIGLVWLGLVGLIGWYWLD